MLDRGAIDSPSTRAPSRSNGGRSLPTPISGRNRSAGRGRSKGRKHGSTPPRVSRACIHCGGPVPSGRMTCGDACEQATRAIGVDTFASAGAEALRKRHAEGVAVQLTDAGRGRLRDRASSRVREARAWQREHAWPSDPDRFEREILSGLANVPVRDLVKATGLSDAYCRRIKRGQVVPHPMWWDALWNSVKPEPE